MNERSEEDKIRGLTRMINRRAIFWRRVRRDITYMTRLALRYAQEDIESGAPDRWEEFDSMTGRLDRVLEFYLGELEDELRRITEAALGTDTSVLSEHIHQIEDDRRSMANLRLDMHNFMLRFEGELTEAERLELMMSLPTPEEEAAEKKRAYETGGGSLVQDQAHPS